MSIAQLMATGEKAKHQFTSRAHLMLSPTPAFSPICDKTEQKSFLMEHKWASSFATPLSGGNCWTSWLDGNLSKLLRSRALLGLPCGGCWNCCDGAMDWMVGADCLRIIWWLSSEFGAIGCADNEFMGSEYLRWISPAVDGTGGGFFGLKNSPPFAGFGAGCVGAEFWRWRIGGMLDVMFKLFNGFDCVKNCKRANREVQGQPSTTLSARLKPWWMKKLFADSTADRQPSFCYCSHSCRSRN